jgi:hypothetical protein
VHTQTLLVSRPNTHLMFWKLVVLRFPSLVAAFLSIKALKLSPFQISTPLIQNESERHV